MHRIHEHLTAQKPCRIVALGSSNTERAQHSEGQYNWFDWLDIGISSHHGRIHHSINVGVCGETSTDLLARFDSAVEVYQPHIVLLTVGGNDSNPARQLSPTQFRDNLLELTQHIGANPQTLCVLQTYYSPVESLLDPLYFQNFHEYMDIIREVAASENLPLIDNLQRWEHLRAHDPQLHQSLMRDGMHVNPLGNMLWGLDTARAFGVDVELLRDFCSEGLALQDLLDQLAAKQ